MERYDFTPHIWNNGYNGLTLNITRTPTALNLTTCEDIVLTMRRAADNKVAKRYTLLQGDLTVASASQLVINATPDLGLPAGKYTYTLDFLLPTNNRKTYVYGNRNLINADGSY